MRCCCQELLDLLLRAWWTGGVERETVQECGRDVLAVEADRTGAAADDRYPLAGRREIDRLLIGPPCRSTHASLDDVAVPLEGEHAALVEVRPAGGERSRSSLTDDVRFAVVQSSTSPPREGRSCAMVWCGTLQTPWPVVTCSRPALESLRVVIASMGRLAGCKGR